MNKYLLIAIILTTLTASASGSDIPADNRIQPDTYFEDTDSFVTSLKDTIITTLSRFFSPEVTVFIISMLPIFELRGSIPVGINLFRLNWLFVWFISIVGNMVPIFFVLLFFDWVTKLFSKIPILKRLLDWLFERTRKRSGLIEKYEELALILFVAIPLPITGAWTGSLAAYLLGLKFWKSILCIFLGVLIASVIVTSLSLLGRYGAIIALTVLTGFFCCKLLSIKKERKKLTAVAKRN